jgi:YfiH family protein
MKSLHVHGVQFFVSSLLEDPSLIHGFSTRLGGVSSGPYADLNLWYESEDLIQNIQENRKRLATALGIRPRDIATARQTHGDHLLELVRPLEDRSVEADGMVTSQPGVFLAVGTADCVPILLWDPKHRVIGAVHTGWKGTQLRIATRAVEKMRDVYKSKPAQIRAAIGPAAGPCCYEVGPEVARGFAREFLLELPDGETHLDMWKANRQQLLDAGLKEENIGTSDLCTICRPDLFFSYRRDLGVTGGMLSIIGLKGTS